MIDAIPSIERQNRVADAALSCCMKDVFGHPYTNIPYFRNMFRSVLRMACRGVKLAHCHCIRLSVNIHTLYNSLKAELLGVPEVGEGDTVRFVYMVMTIRAMIL